VHESTAQEVPIRLVRTIGTGTPHRLVRGKPTTSTPVNQSGTGGNISHNPKGKEEEVGRTHGECGDIGVNGAARKRKKMRENEYPIEVRLGLSKKKVGWEKRLAWNMSKFGMAKILRPKHAMGGKKMRTQTGELQKKKRNWLKRHKLGTRGLEKTKKFSCELHEWEGEVTNGHQE